MSNVAFESCRLLLEKIIEDRHIDNIYNCTEGGALLKGIENMSLKAAHKKYIAKNKIDRSLLKKFECDYDFEQYPSRRAALCELQQHFNSVKDISEKGIKAFTVLKDLLDREREGDSLTILEKASKVSSTDDVNHALGLLFKDYRQELEYVSSTSKASFVLFKLMESINNADYSAENMEADNRNKAALFLCSIDDGMDSFIKNMDVLLEKLDKEYEKRMPKKKSRKKGDKDANR